MHTWLLLLCPLAQLATATAAMPLCWFWNALHMLSRMRIRGHWPYTHVLHPSRWAWQAQSWAAAGVASLHQQLCLADAMKGTSCDSVSMVCATPLLTQLAALWCCRVPSTQVWGVCEAPVPRLTLPVRANVCSIKFSPAAPHMLAAGNAGHQVGACWLAGYSATFACHRLLWCGMRGCINACRQPWNNNFTCSGWSL